MSDDLARVGPVYAYEFNDRDAPAPEAMRTLPFPVGASHSLELRFLFEVGGAEPLDPAQQKLSDQMLDYWSRFVIDRLAGCGRPTALAGTGQPTSARSHGCRCSPTAVESSPISTTVISAGSGGACPGNRLTSSARCQRRIPEVRRPVGARMERPRRRGGARAFPRRRRVHLAGRGAGAARLERRGARKGVPAPLLD